MDYKNIDPAKLVETLFTECPLELYDYLLRGTLTEVYTELKKTYKEGWTSYSSLDRQICNSFIIIFSFVEWYN